jgi:hypothetical protein
MPEQHLVEQRLSVDRVFEGKPQVIVVERLGVRAHDQDIVAAAGHRLDGNCFRPAKKRRDLGRDTIYHVHLAGLNGR